MGTVQIFTNADKVHAAKVLHRLGLEDCFEGVICFETLNPSPPSPSPSQPQQYSVVDDGIIIQEDQNGGNWRNPKVLCKPSVLAMEAAIQIANLHPNKTVRSLILLLYYDFFINSHFLFVLFLFWLEKFLRNISILFSQIAFYALILFYSIV